MHVIFFTPDSYLVGMAIWLVALALAPRWLLKCRRRWSGQARRQTLVKLLLSCWFALAVLTAIEVGFAVLYDTTDSFDMTNVSHRWFQAHAEPDLKPLAFNDGTGIEFRDDREFPLTPPEDSRHVVFLGDSFTFGHGVADVTRRFTNVARRQTESDSSGTPKLMISNLSKPGSDLIWSEAVLQHLFDDRRRVDVAVQVMCLNDIEAFHPQFMDFNNQVSELRTGPQFFLLRDTYFFNWAYFRCLLLTRSDVRNYYDFVRDYYAGPEWTAYLRKLDQVAALCKEHDCRFGLVIFPFLHNLGSDYPFEAVHRQIVDACQERHIPHLDLLPLLQPQATKGLTVNPFDAHPNESAHQIVGEALPGWLRTIENQQ